MAEVTWEIRINHVARHGVRPARNPLRWLVSLLREIGDGMLEPFRPRDWLPT
jgi:hypothetical protein